MQKLKGDIEERILASARDQFLRHGYSRASMRGIASAAGVSAGNLYNYFPNKDELFRRVVAPAITLLEEMLRKHHGQKGTDVRDMLSEQYRLQCMREYTALVSMHRRPMEILFFHAEGSSYEKFLDRFTDYATDLTVDWFRHLDGAHPGIGPEHAYLRSVGRAEYVPVTDDEAVGAFEYLARTEGIICAIESAHAVAEAMKLAPKLGRDESIVVCLSGRGDKDVAAIARYKGVDIHE